MKEKTDNKWSDYSVLVCVRRVAGILYDQMFVEPDFTLYTYPFRTSTLEK